MKERCNTLSSKSAVLQIPLQKGEYVKDHGGFPGSASGKEFTASEGDIRHVSLIPRLGRSPGEGNGYPLQYSRLETARAESLAGWSMGSPRAGQD